MRSSIACARCRRSKVKCVNNGVGTTCRACESTGRECTYPTPGAGGSAARKDAIVVGAAPSQDAAAANSVTGETPKRRPPKKSIAPVPHAPAQKDSLRALVDALDTNLLTPKVWMELFDIFQLHFSTDLPFLHPPTFLKPLRQNAAQLPLPSTTAGAAEFGSPIHDRTGATPSPPLAPPLLLAFLALTSRFHPQLVAHHSPPSSSRPSNPLVAAEYYAAAARAKLIGDSGDLLEVPTLERTQTLLMLALHEWGMCQGAKAWLSLGVAVRSAQILGFQYEQELDDEPLARSLALNSEAQHMGIEPKRKPSRTGFGGGSDAFIAQEIRRRTFWSCFILDRYMSSGKYRPQMLHVKEIRIQLPSSERAFLFGEKVRTLLIGEEEADVEGRAEVQSKRHAAEMLGTVSNGTPYSTNGSSRYDAADIRQREDEEKGRWEVGTDEGVISRFIKLTDLYGKMLQWSCRGGRRTEAYPPWDERSTFHGLQKSLTVFKEQLPRDLTLTYANISAHINLKTSTPYILMHCILALCHIVLHREYIPFLPLRCARPMGPLDPPLFPPDQYQIPEGFWENSARQLFKSARELMDLLRTCEEWGVLVETPLVGFATYTAAFTGVYAINFPQMDPEGHMCTRRTNSGEDRSGYEATSKALEIIRNMRPRLKMAENWTRTIKRSHVYFRRMKWDFKRNTNAVAASSGSESGSPETTRALSIREGGAGGGLAEYKLLELTLKEFGRLEDEDLEMADAPGMERRITNDDNSETGSAAVKSEGMELQEGTPDSSTVRQERWNAINSVAAAASQQRDVAMSGVTGSHVAYQANAMGAGQHQLPPGTMPMQHPSSSSTPMVSPAAGSIPGSSIATPYNAPMYPQHKGYDQQTQQQHPGQKNMAHLQPPLQAPAQVWSPQMKEQWLNSLDTRLGGDDVAAFVDGSSWEDWALMAAGAPGIGGWLSAVWGTAASGHH